MFQNTFYYVMSNVEVMVHKCGSDGATNVDVVMIDIVEVVVICCDMLRNVVICCDQLPVHFEFFSPVSDSKKKPSGPTA